MFMPKVFFFSFPSMEMAPFNVEASLFNELYLNCTPTAKGRLEA